MSQTWTETTLLTADGAVPMNVQGEAAQTVILMTAVLMALAGCHDSAPESSDASGTTGTTSTSGTDATSGTDGTTGIGVEPCMPSTTTCDDRQLLHCNAAGVGRSFVCDGGCRSDGECQAAETVCTAGTRSCEGKQVVECNAAGTSAETVKKCDFGCDTGTATCKAPACASGAARCAPDSPDQVEICNSDQSGWSASPMVCPLSCNDGTCTVGLCTPGDTRCGGGGVETCGQLGLTYSLTEACDFGCVGDSGGEVCATCPKGAIRCDGVTPQRCVDPESGWKDEQDCSGGTTRAEGNCVSALVLPASAEDTYLALVKAFVDCWVTTADGLCLAIDSTGYASDVTLGEIKAWFCAGAGDAAFAAQFEDQDEYFLASDVLGACAASDPANEQDVSFNLMSITAGESGVTCIGFSGETTLSSPDGREVIVDLCSAF